MVTGTHSASYAWYVDNPFDMNSYTFKVLSRHENI